jgi:hypothetical protein
MIRVFLFLIDTSCRLGYAAVTSHVLKTQMASF